jgi:hypothetical protein
MDLQGFTASAPPPVATSPAPSYAPALPDDGVDATPTSSVPPHDD